MNKLIRKTVLIASLMVMPLSLSALAQSSVDPTTTGRTTVAQPADNDNTGDWGWVGLLGLIGLAGLMRRREDVASRRVNDVNEPMASR